MLQDAADTLLKTVGEPQDWDPDSDTPSLFGFIQYYPNGKSLNKLSADGRNLVIYDISTPESLSHRMYRKKFNFLNTAGNEVYLYNLTGTTKTYLTITKLSDGSSFMTIGNPPPSNASQVYNVERRVLYEYQPSDASNLTTIMLYQRTIDTADWADLCDSEVPGPMNCTIETNLKINFSIPHKDFSSDYFNITGNITFPTTVEIFDFAAENISTNGNDMDEGSNCEPANDEDDILIRLDGGGIVGDVYYTVCGEKDWLNLTNQMTIDTINVEMWHNTLGSPCGPTCFPTESITIDIWADIPLTTFDTDYAKMVLQTWK
jgi:hypothetical protein